MSGYPKGEPYPKKAASHNIAMMEREAKAGHAKGRSRKQRIAIGISKARRDKRM